MYLNAVSIIGAFIAFAVVHSLTAGTMVSDRLKHWIPDRVVEGWYRLAYNAFSLITFAPVIVLIYALPDYVVYSASGFVMILLRLAQLVALAGLAWALVSIDFWRFAGLRQALAFMAGASLPLKAEPLSARGIYAVMRHPLYIFSMLFLWAAPVMSFNWLLFNIGATMYFVIGAIIEERRLVAAFGEQYVHYRNGVGIIGTRRAGR
jgi:protein-S-isoprenylcysteine O-methyltransferase Ste14